jgi:hypothetical protein
MPWAVLFLSAGFLLGFLNLGHALDGSPAWGPKVTALFGALALILGAIGGALLGTEL